jgi:hypothetical protein
MGNRLASVGDTAFRAARSLLPRPEQEGRLCHYALVTVSRGRESGPSCFLGSSDALVRRDSFRGERGQVQPELLEDLAVEKPHAVEALVRA